MAALIKLLHADDPLLDKLLSLALKNPLDNCFVIADLTQLRCDCTTAALIRDGEPMASASFYRDLPFKTIALMAETAHDARAVVEKLAEAHPELTDGPVYDFYPKRIAGFLRKCFHVVGSDTEYQMVLRGAIPDVTINPRYNIRRLTSDDLPAASRLFELVPAMAWTPRAFGFGPFFGAFHDGDLVSIAGVHYGIPEIAEIGNIATNPEHRGRNLAYACAKLVAETLRNQSRIVFLCVKAENAKAFELYRRMGFEVHQELEILEFQI
jgi:ribosomal protein S18 acetylase RimI-like enzyme